MMGKMLDLSGLTEEEVEHVLEVVRRDMRLRRKEEERLSEMRQELEEEDTRCLLLSKQELFNKRCCMRCCSPFSFLLNRKRPCADCGYNVCRRCRSFHKKERVWLCTACTKSRLLRTRALEWYYSVLKRRYRRFGSTKVLKSLYRKYITDQGILAELAEGSVYDDSIYNEGSGTESPFRRNSEDHSMAETLNVALQVAEEAVEEAIARTEEHCDNLEKQDEVRYLQDNKDELIEELATSIVQKIVRRRRKLSQMQPQYEMDLPQQCGEGTSSPSTLSRQNTIPSQASLKGANSLWRSRSAFSLTSEAAPDEHVPEPRSDSSVEVRAAVKGYASLRRDTVASLASWKSVDRLDNSMLQSPDGNWIALQSTQLSRPSLLTKRKSLVFSALEQESGSISAYHDMGSDTEPEADSGWGAALLEFRRKMSHRESEWTDIRGPSTGPPSPQLPPELGMPGTPDTPGTPGSPARSQVQLLSSLRRMGRRQSIPRCSHGLDINLNPDFAGSASVDSSEVEDGKGERVGRSRRRRTKHERLEQAGSPCMQYSSSVPDYSNLLLNVIVKNFKLEGPPPSSSPGHPMTPDTVTSSAAAPDVRNVDFAAHRAKDVGPVGLLEMELHSELRELSDQPAEEPGARGAEREKMRNDTSKEGQRSEAQERQVVTGCSMESVKAGQVGGEENVNIEVKGPKEREDLEHIGAEPAMDGKIIDEERQAHAEAEGKLKDQAKRLSVQHDGGQVEVQKGNPEKSDGGRRIKVETEKAEESDEVIEVLIAGEGLQEVDGEIEVGEEVGILAEMNVEDGLEAVLDDPGQAETTNEKVGELGSEKGPQVDPEEHGESEKGKPGEAEIEVKEKSGEREAESAEKVETLNKVEETGEEKTEVGGNEPVGLETLQQKVEMIEGGDTEAVETSMEGIPSTVETMLAEDVRRKHSAASLSSITAEVLKVLNATEDLIEEAGGSGRDQAAPSSGETPPSDQQSAKKLDEHLTKLEENVYLAAGTVFKLEGELVELEECARSISSITTEEELAHLEEQVASAAAQVQQSDLQVSGIAARISALKSAGLNVAPSAAPQKTQAQPQTQTQTQTQTIAVSRQQRRKLPHPPSRKGSDHKSGPKSRALRS